MMFDEAEYSPSPEEPYRSIHTLTPTRKKKNRNQRRFSDEQIKSLESIFESESRLEPRKKLQLAKDLGLQPRQVAIWFQNKRARWKSKQLERDYNILLANYNSLASKFETLKKDKQALAVQLQKLNDRLQKPREEGECCGDGVAVNSSEGESENRDATKCDSEAKRSLSSSLVERSSNGLGIVVSDEDSSIKVEYLGLEEEPDLVGMMEPGDGSLTTSQEDWGGLESDGLFDQSDIGCQWWDFWV